MGSYHFEMIWAIGPLKPFHPVVTFISYYSSSCQVNHFTLMGEFAFLLKILHGCPLFMYWTLLTIPNKIIIGYDYMENVGFLLWTSWVLFHKSLWLWYELSWSGLIWGRVVFLSVVICISLLFHFSINTFLFFNDTIHNPSFIFFCFDCWTLDKEYCTWFCNPDINTCPSSKRNHHD